MSLLLKAFPHGRPLHPVRTLLVALGALALVLATLPLAGPTYAESPRAQAQRQHAHQQQAKQKHKKKHHPKKHVKKHAKPKAEKPKPKPKPRPVGQPPRSFVVPATSYFSFPNRSRRERLAIRKRVLLSIQSTWGGSRTPGGNPWRSNGSIRIATWSFDDWDIAHALVAARKRGVSVQVVAAKSANKDHPAWHWLRKKLGQRLYRPGRPTTREMYSFARQCKGACRGPGGTPHAKYFLFNKVGPAKVRKISFQTSSNLTSMAYQGQWNQAQVSHSPAVYDDFMSVFRQARLGRSLADPYHVAAIGSTTDYFFPRPQAKAAEDPVMQILDNVTCRGATAGGRAGRTKIRVDQYAIYGDRGVWIAKKLRLLWKGGCDVSIIYSVSSRPVLTILRNPTGRGPIPMRQSVEKDYWGNIVKYNHSKWMTISGHWGKSTGTYQVFSGSANWANLAFGDDEQMQRISSRHELLRYNAVFAKTWRQPSSSEPSYGRTTGFGRTAATAPLGRDVPRGRPHFGSGIFRYMTPD